jgi:hypothetical protein
MFADVLGAKHLTKKKGKNEVNILEHLNTKTEQE